MKFTLRSKLTLLFMMLAVMLALPAMALADTIRNDIVADANNQNTKNYTIGGDAAEVKYYVDNTSSGGQAFQACDATPSSPAYVTVNLPSKVTASSSEFLPLSAGKGANTLKFEGCGDASSKTVNFEASEAGRYTITVSVSDNSGNYNTNNASFFLDVQNAPAPPANNAPVVVNDAGDVNGTEGDTLQNSGSFSDADGDPLSLSATGPGQFTDNGDGTWSWSLATNDDASGSVTVQASDGKGGTASDSFNYTAVNANPQLSALSLSGNSGTACIGGNNVGLGFSFSDPGSADTHQGTIDWGDGSSTTFSDSSVNESHSYSPGTYTINVNVSDDDGGSDSESSGAGAVSFSYNLSGLLAPVNANGSSVFKSGSTIPMKVRILDCDSLPVSGLAPSIKFQKMSGSNPVQDINESVSTSAADTSNVMRYSDGIYIYNLASKSLPDPTATYRAVISEGSSTPKPLESQNFSLKK